MSRLDVNRWRGRTGRDIKTVTGCEHDIYFLHSMNVYAENITFFFRHEKLLTVKRILYTDPSFEYCINFFLKRLWERKNNSRKDWLWRIDVQLYSCCLVSGSFNILISQRKSYAVDYYFKINEMYFPNSISGHSFPTIFSFSFFLEGALSRNCFGRLARTIWGALSRRKQVKNCIKTS